MATMRAVQVSSPGSTDKADLAVELGAHHYIDSIAQDPAEELARLGGAAVVLATVTNAEAMSSVIAGLASPGRGRRVHGPDPGPTGSTDRRELVHRGTCVGNPRRTRRRHWRSAP